MSDGGFISDYLAYNSFNWFPQNFHRAMAHVLVGLAVGRRAWATDGPWPIYPLSHCIMVADSGVGKGAAVEMMSRVQRKALPSLAVARKEGSAAGILKRLPLSDDRGKQVAPLLIEAGEMTTLLNRMEHLGNLVSVLTELADNNRYGKSLRDEFIEIEDIQTSIVLGTNEKALREHFTASIIETGLASRFTWLTAGWATKPLDRVPDSDPQVQAAFQAAVGRLREVSSSRGEWTLDAPAAAWFRSWQEGNDQGPPPDRTLSGYWSRRYIRLLQVALVSALSRGSVSNGLIDLADMEYAWGWVQDTERQMNEAFGSLRLSGYGQVETQVEEWLAARPDGANWTEACREWSGRMAGKESVRRVLDSLVASGRVTVGRTKGGGERFRKAEAN